MKYLALDPANWQNSLRLAVLGLLIAVMAVAVWFGPRSTGATLAVSLIPALVGGLIWRFDGLPWIDIASWTLPLAFWVGALLWIIPGSVGLLFGGASVMAWLYAFIFWTRVTRWWYASLLRKPYPGSQGHSGGA